MRELLFFFFNDTATTEIYTLSLHDALPILSEEAALFSELDEVLQPGAAGFGVLGAGLRAQQQRAFGVAVAARPAGFAQLQELLRLKLELGLELFFLLLGEERRFLRPCLLQRSELSGSRLLAGGELLRLGFFARDALTLPLLFLGGLEARLFLCRALARPLPIQGLARAFLLLHSFHPRRIQGSAGLVLLPSRLRPGRFLRFLLAKLFYFPGSLGARQILRLARTQTLFLRPQPLGGLGFLRLEPCCGLCARL